MMTETEHDRIVALANLLKATIGRVDAIFENQPKSVVDVHSTVENLRAVRLLKMLLDQDPTAVEQAIALNRTLKDRKEQQ